MPTPKSFLAAHRPVKTNRGARLIPARLKPLGRAHREFARRLQARYLRSLVLVRQRLYYLGLLRRAHATVVPSVTRLNFLLKLAVRLGNQKTLSGFTFKGREPWRGSPGNQAFVYGRLPGWTLPGMGTGWRGEQEKSKAGEWQKQIWIPSQRSSLFPPFVITPPAAKFMAPRRPMRISALAEKRKRSDHTPDTRDATGSGHSDNYRWLQRKPSAIQGARPSFPFASRISSIALIHYKQFQIAKSQERIPPQHKLTQTRARQTGSITSGGSGGFLASPTFRRSIGAFRTPTGGDTQTRLLPPRRVSRSLAVEFPDVSVAFRRTLEKQSTVQQKPGVAAESRHTIQAPETVPRKRVAQEQLSHVSARLGGPLVSISKPEMSRRPLGLRSDAHASVQRSLGQRRSFCLSHLVRSETQSINASNRRSVSASVRDEGPNMVDRSPLQLAAIERSVPSPYQAVSSPLVVSARPVGNFEVRTGGRDPVTISPVSKSRTEVAELNQTDMTVGLPTDWRPLADRVYEHIVTRIKTELRMRGR